MQRVIITFIQHRQRDTKTAALLTHHQLTQSNTNTTNTPALVKPDHTPHATSTNHSHTHPPHRDIAYPTYKYVLMLGDRVIDNSTTETIKDCYHQHLRTGFGRRLVAGWLARYIHTIHKPHDTFLTNSITRPLLLYTAPSHTRALRSNTTYAKNHTWCIARTNTPPPTPEELAYCPFCARRRSRKKGNTPHLHIECSNKHLMKTRYIAAKVLHQALQPICTLLSTAPTLHPDFKPDKLSRTISTSLLTLDNAPIPSTATFEATEPTTSPPQQRRITDPCYWQRCTNAPDTSTTTLVKTSL